MSIRIEVHQGICKVFCDKDTRTFIQDLLTREVKNAKYIKKNSKTKWDGKYRFFNQMNNSFKVGLLDYVCRGLEEAGYEEPVILEKRWTFPLQEEELPVIKVYDKNLNLVLKFSLSSDLAYKYTLSSAQVMAGSESLTITTDKDGSDNTNSYELGLTVSALANGVYLI